jgi:hypothetical protein
MYSKKIEALRSSLETLKVEKDKADQDGRRSFVRFANMSIFIMLLDLDRYIFLIQFLKERDEFVQHVHAKHLAGIIYALFEKIGVFLGKEVRDLIEKLPESQKHLAEMESLGVRIRAYSKKHEKSFKFIRDKITAHRDINIDQQLEAIASINPSEIRRVATEMETWHGDLYAFITSVVKSYTNSTLMIQEMFSKVSPRLASSDGEQGGPGKP